MFKKTIAVFLNPHIQLKGFFMQKEMSDLEKIEELEFYFTDLLDSIRVIKKALKDNYRSNSIDISRYANNVHKKVNAIYKILYSRDVPKH